MFYSEEKKQFAPENNTAVFMDLKREKKKGKIERMCEKVKKNGSMT